MRSGESKSLTLAGGVRVRRTVEQKRRIVEETLEPGNSVARVARAHGINANQVFQWRRLYQQGLLEGEETVPQLIPVRLKANGNSDGRIELEFAEARLSIEGSPDPATLRLILEKVLG
jgi:transposase